LLSFIYVDVYLFQLQVIGEGEFGMVYKGQYMTDEGAVRPVAVKVLNDVDEEQTKDFVQVKFGSFVFILTRSFWENWNAPLNKFFSTYRSS
jgi:hypothetical protein